MQCIVNANPTQRNEISDGMEDHSHVQWITSASEFLNYSSADLFLDLQFEPTPERIKLLGKLLPKPIIVNSVLYTLNDISIPCIRINGWPGFLKGPVIEASGDSSLLPPEFEVTWKKKIEWLNDLPGFISPRVIAMIINEAYLTLEDEISTRDDIDTAMKLGTNYPFGPFEWSKKIGLQNIYLLLQLLSISEIRYAPSALLKQEATVTWP